MKYFNIPKLIKSIYYVYTMNTDDLLKAGFPEPVINIMTMQQKERKNNEFYVTELVGCLRKSAYNIIYGRKDALCDMLRKAYGRLIHAGIVQPLENWSYEREVRIQFKEEDIDICVVGKYDMLDMRIVKNSFGEEGHVLWDLKTVSDKKIDKLYKLEQNNDGSYRVIGIEQKLPERSYLNQILMYSAILRETGMPIVRAGVLYLIYPSLRLNGGILKRNGLVGMFLGGEYIDILYSVISASYLCAYVFEIGKVINKAVIAEIKERARILHECVKSRDYEKAPKIPCMDCYSCNADCPYKKTVID